MSRTRACQLGTDEVSFEILKKAFVWYYRIWSYYWDERPTCCIFHPAESFVELADEVICFKRRKVTEEDVRRLKTAFAQPITFIAENIPENQHGYILCQRACHNPTAWLKHFLAKIDASYADLRDAVSDGRTRERERQEWRFAEAGVFINYYDGKTKRVNLAPEGGLSYTYTIIKSNSEGLYFTESKKGPAGKPIERGAYRRHRHQARNQISENLDFFPKGGDPVLWRFVQAGRGFRAFLRKNPGTP